MKRNATAIWQGTGKEGKGSLSSQSGVLEDTAYSFSSRFEDGKGTNPEELVAAAHAGCFAMKLSFNLSAAGFTPEKLEAKSTVTLADGAVSSSHIKLDAHVPGISEQEFNKQVKDAEKNCPISKLLNCEIKVESELNA